MADASLDDFFAKKDKSKKKSKSSKLTPGDILAKTDETKKEKKKKEKEKILTAANTTNNSNTIGPSEEEWNEIEEEKEKDYTGLRIANLQVSEKEEEEEEEKENNEDNSDGENKEKKDSGQQGPWKGATTNPTLTTPTVQEEEPPKPEPVKSTGKYIPPSQRAAAAAGSGTTGPTIPSHLRKKKVAPNIKSEEDFPTLGGSPMPAPVDSDTRNFEKVQHGGRQMDDPSKIKQALSLGNKFSALQD